MVAGPLAWDPPLADRDHPGRGWALVVALVAVVAIVAAFVPLPYELISPGETRQVNDLFVLGKAAKTYPPHGQFLYTTVSVRDNINVYELISGWASSVDDIESEKNVRGAIPQKVFDQLNRDFMDQSKRAAEVVALAKLGVKSAQGAQIENVDPQFAGAAALQRGDVVTAVDGREVASPEEFVAIIRTHKPGDRMHLRLSRAGAGREVDVTVGNKEGSPLLGVRVSPFVKPPFDINIDSGDVVGPSAGLAYALGLYDLLTPGELTGGVKVAATGELGLDGKVVAIGGIAQKAVSVRRSGVQVLLVPRANYAEAKRHSGKRLRVYPIDDFESALRALERFKADKASAR